MGIEPVEMIDHESRDGLGRRESDIDGYATASILVDAQSSPAKHATTCWAEVDFQAGLRFVRSCVDAARSRNSNSFAFIVVRPQGSISAAERTVAGGYRARVALQAPAQCAAMTRSVKHGSVYRDAGAL